MGKYSYRYVEEKHDKEKRNQKKIDELEGVIEGLIEYENESGFTDEQCFLISYYGLDKEKCKNIKFNMNNIIDNINEMKSVPSIPSEKLEENRHEALLDLFFATENFSEDCRNFRNVRLTAELCRKHLLRLHRTIRQVTETSGYSDRGVVSKITLQLT